MKKQSKADKAFIKKIASLQVSVPKGTKLVPVTLTPQFHKDGVDYGCVHDAKTDEHIGYFEGRRNRKPKHDDTNEQGFSA